MDAFIDLSIIVFLLNFIISFIYSLIIFDNVKYKIHFIILTIILSILSLFINMFIVPYFYIMFFILYSLFISIFNIKLLKSLISCLIIFYINYSFLLLIGGCFLYNGILMISTPFVTLFIFIVPIYITLIHIIFSIIYKKVKYNKFKIKCFIRVNEKLYKGYGYYDSGNSLLFNDKPVIFINDKCVFNNGEVINVKGINNYMFKYLAYKATLIIKGNIKDVYVVFINQNVDFCNCKFLLNKYIY